MGRGSSQRRRQGAGAGARADGPDRCGRQGRAVGGAIGGAAGERTHAAGDTDGARHFAAGDTDGARAPASGSRQAAAHRECQPGGCQRGSGAVGGDGGLGEMPAKPKAAVALAPTASMASSALLLHGSPIDLMKPASAVASR